MSFFKKLLSKTTNFKPINKFFMIFLLAMILTLASGSSAVLAVHSSTVTVTPHIVPASVSADFNAHVECTGGPDPIHEFRVYEPLEFSGLVCDPVIGWYDPFYAYTTIGGDEYYYCQWNAKTGSELYTGETEDFSFSLDTSETECCRDLFVETRDDHGYYEFHNPQVCVDTSAPITTKSFIGPYKIDPETEVEWIDGVTLINLTAIDPEPHPSGIDKTWYINIWLPECNDPCLDSGDCIPEKYCDSPYNIENYEGCIDEGQYLCEDEADYIPYTDDWYDCVEEWVYYECEVDCEGQAWKLYRGPFLKKKESCHVLLFFSVDNVGNVEDVKANCFFVDKTAPFMDKDNGDAIWDNGEPAFVKDDVPPESPYYNPDGAFHWITTNMPIIFTCDDTWGGDKEISPHPSEDEKLCFRVSYDYVEIDDTGVYDWGYITEDYCDPMYYVEEPCGEDNCTWCCVPVDENKEYEFYFQNESMHDLEYYCKDAVEKKTDPHIQYYKVDDTPPNITKKMIGDDHLGDCPPRDLTEYPENNDTCYVRDDDENGVNISVVDGGEICAVDDVNCIKYLFWETTPPECDMAGGEWIPGAGPLPTPFVKTITNGNGGGICLLWSDEFTEYQEFYFQHDSTHWLIVICEDALGNIEVDIEKFLVDSTPPESDKWFGEPYVEDWYPKGCYEQYMDCVVSCEGDPKCIEERCFECGWAEWINSSTPVYMNATDKKVGVDKIWYKNILACGDLPCEDPYNYCSNDTDHPYDNPNTVYCINKGQDLCDDEEGGWEDQGFSSWEACVEGYVHTQCGDNNLDLEWHLWDGNPITKPDESCHILYYFSVDKLGNVEPIEANCFFVDNTPPETDKIIGTPQYGDCPPEEGERCYISGETPITLKCWDDEPHPVDHVSLWYRYRVSDDCENWGDWLPVEEEECEGEIVNGWCDPSNPYLIEKTIYFPEDSCHELEYYCVDGLGNAGPVHSEIDIVDNQPPVIEKEVIGPQIDCPPTPEPESCIKWDCFGEGDEKDFFITGRHDPTNWDMAIWNGDPEQVEEQGEYWWDNGGEPVPFGLEYDADTGEVTYTLDGETLTWTYDAEKAFEYILLMAKGKEGGCDMALTGVEVNGESVGDVISDGNYEGLKVYLSDAEQTEGFKVSGYAAMIWDECKEQEIPAFHIFAMNTHDPIEDCYQIDGVTLIQVKATDPEPHPVGEVLCSWDYDVIDSEKMGSGQSELIPPFNISFPEESTHILYIKCWDALGNIVYDTEMFIVDKTPPEIHKIYDGPYYSGIEYDEEKEEEYCAEWINHETTIQMSANDVGPHLSGIGELKYRITTVNNEYCKDYDEDDYECEDATGTDEWTTVEGYVEGEIYETNIPDESCHLIEIYAEDGVEKHSTHKQCVFVDNTPPYPEKTVGDPKDYWTPGDNGDEISHHYPEANDLCWTLPKENNECRNAGPEVCLECWEVTQLTPITMDCIDPEPHPVDHEKVCFKLDLDGEDETEVYCSQYYGEMTDDGFCCIDYTDDFHFIEDSEHELEYYCVDALENTNKENLDIEKFKVEGTMFEVPLFLKWNLISVPFVLLNDDPEAIFNENDTPGVESVWAYDPENEICNDNWCKYTPDGIENDNLDRITPGWGYWIYETEDEEWLTIGGNLIDQGPVDMPHRQLVEGWNLIGYYGASWELYEWGDFNFVCGDAFNFPDKYIYGDKAYCALYSLVNTEQGYPKWDAVWNYINCGDHHDAWIGINTCVGDGLEATLSRLYAGRGYWIHLDEADEYGPATTCIWNDDWECVWTGGGIIP